MNVHFGVVKEYFPQKGFGFVTHPLESSMHKNTFFHIYTVQKYNKDIAEKLSSYEPGDDIYFYYEAENTPKGHQVKSILPTEGIGKLLESNLDDFYVKLHILWYRIKPEPIWLHDVTQDLFGTDRLNEYIKKQEVRRKEKEKIEKKRQKELELQERQRKIRDEERQKKLELEEQQRKVKDKEFELLVAEIEPKGFTKSGQVSNYIIKHRLGDKYKHISGILVMENDDSSWNFNGGFPPDIYAKLCQKLGLGNEGTNSRVVGFTAFKDL